MQRRHEHDYDVIIGGGGVAGASVAAAMHQLGLRVLVVEPGLNDARRLAGEVFHPPGVIGLAELGLLSALRSPDAIALEGFSVSVDGDRIQLPYDSVHAHRTSGLSLEHGLIRSRMLDAVAKLPGVTVAQGARVVGIDQSDASQAIVNVSTGDESRPYRCGMVIAADGTSSHLARLSGIRIANRRISTILGYRITTQNLPQAGFGHVFLGGETPILVYPISQTQARVLFDLPNETDRRAGTAGCITLAAALPSALRAEVAQAIETQPRLSFVTQATVPDRVAHGRMALVGDAGGCCHPLTASGMTMCISDALLLRRALADAPDDVPAGLRLYQERRHWPQATRLVLADALRDALCGASPALRVIRRGILTHWQHNADGRAATMALLSTADGRPSVLLRHIAAVMARGLVAHIRSPSSTEGAVGALSLTCSLAADLFRNVRHIARHWTGAGRLFGMR